jgi:hypothetical protein
LTWLIQSSGYFSVWETKLYQDLVRWRGRHRQLHSRARSQRKNGNKREDSNVDGRNTSAVWMALLRMHPVMKAD